MNSSPPSSSPVKRRQKQPKSCRLVRLPTSVLRRIFNHLDDVSLDKVTLWRALEPMLVQGLYRVVTLDTARKIRSFATALVEHPERGRLVETLLLDQLALTRTRTRGKDPGVELECGEKGAGQLHDLATAPLRKDLVIGIGLLKDIVQRLPRVDALTVCGDQLAGHLFSPAVAAQPDFARLGHVYIILAPAVGSPRVPALWRHLSAIPDLHLLVVHNLDPAAAGTMLNLDPATHLAPRSLHVTTLSLTEAASFGPGLRHVLSGLAYGVEVVHLESWVSYRSILDDLVLIPPSLTRLEVSLGLSMCATPTAAADPAYRSLIELLDRATRETPDGAPLPLTTSLIALPNLVTISLQGDIVSSETFENLAGLEHLETLRLGTHTRFETSDVVEFVWAASALETLWVEVCCCVPLAVAGAARGSARAAARASSTSTSSPTPTKPTWRPGFSLTDARTLVDECFECGVVVGGTIACASGRFGPDTHSCEGWCAML
ncbi:hypothetical protein JCM9279_007312 [Rhodotorula babjevae]